MSADSDSDESEFVDASSDAIVDENENLDRERTPLPMEPITISALQDRESTDSRDSEEDEYDELALHQHDFETDLVRSISDIIRDRHRAFMNYVFANQTVETGGGQDGTGEEESTNLAAASSHSYLPLTLETSRGSSEPTKGEYSELEMPILPLLGIVLFPGESLPMRVFSVAHLSILEELTTASTCSTSSGPSKAYIGIINKQSPSEKPKEGMVGTVVEVMTSRRQGGGFGGADNNSLPELVLVCKGVKRFELLTEPTRKRGMLWAQVRLLSDESPCSLKEMYPSTQRLLKRSRYSRAQPCMTYSPLWLYILHDAHRVKQKILNLLDEPGTPIEVDPHQDLASFSFAIAGSLPVGDIQRAELLSCHDVTSRLKMVYDILMRSREAQTELCCRSCGVTIAPKSEVFTVPGADGVVGAYVNPHGIIHQTVTLKSAENLLLEGRAVAEDSWFPGYSWTIAYCTCYNHMGWLFTRNGPRQQVPYFWGVRRSELIDSQVMAQAVVEEEMQEGEEEEEEEEEGQLLNITVSSRSVLSATINNVD